MSEEESVEPDDEEAVSDEDAAEAEEVVTGGCEVLLRPLELCAEPDPDADDDAWLREVPEAASLVGWAPRLVEEPGTSSRSPSTHRPDSQRSDPRQSWSKLHRRTHW